jgi:hypothetical protein
VTGPDWWETTWKRSGFLGDEDSFRGQEGDDLGEADGSPEQVAEQLLRGGN